MCTGNGTEGSNPSVSAKSPAVSGLRALARFGPPAGAILAATFVGILCGAMSAAFLWLLDGATHFRGTHDLVVYALPLAGFAIGLLYSRFGTGIQGGTRLVIQAVHDPDIAVPLRIAPMVLLGTVVTHLFGGSAGREGTAVQMGAGAAEAVARALGVTGARRQHLLLAGIAGGFGSVFGTPVAGAAFALEVAGLRRMHFASTLPALAASFAGDLTTRALGLRHTAYAEVLAHPLTPIVATKWLLFSCAVALVGAGFIALVKGLKTRAERALPHLLTRMFVGGAVLVIAWKIVGTSDYLGLGIPLIARAFTDPHTPMDAFAMKAIFTAITLGAGFIGGEVTPLFVAGALLGNTLSRLLGIPLELAAAVGLASLFAAASRTPIALSLMAAELFGIGVLPHVALVTVVASALMGSRSIYAPTERGGGEEP